ncbi:nucleotide exchange factor GrpE [Streptosporangium sp. NPDC002524]|uniref:nucleotide exchange factor GrpE n=1 Tax=Streptosporangium sp. NPDC002524 TaxID=3154537 RepID=UPI00331A4468
MSETPGRGRPAPRRAGEPRGGYDPPGREPRDRRPYDPERGRDPGQDHDRGRHREDGPGRDAGREARAHERPSDQPSDRPSEPSPERFSDQPSGRRGNGEPQGSPGSETRRDGQGTSDQGADVQEGQAGVPGAQGAQGTSDASNTSDALDTPDGLQRRVLELQALVTDLQDRWRRALADLDNLRKRVSRDAERTRSDERARAAGEWLPVLDNLDRALEHAETDPGSIVDGMRAIRDQAQEVLSRLGYARRDDTGAVFDPARHEAVGVLAREGVPDGTVLQVLRPGYGDGEQQLRPALVVVAKGA